MRRWAPPSGAGRTTCLLLLHFLTVLHGAAAQGEPPDCNAGYHLAKDQCRGCPQGTYKSTVGQGPCVFCPKDSNGRNASTHGEGATSVTQCYFRPFLISFEPLHGPIAGGTRVNLTFGYLEERIFQRARFGDAMTTNCTREGPSFICYTPDVAEPQAALLKMELTDNAGEYVLRGPSNFSYLPDPVIDDVDDPKTFLSGGKVLTIFGAHLDSVAAPGMFVTSVGENGQRRFHSDCSLVNSTQMICPTPNLTESVPPEVAVGRQSVQPVRRDKRDAEVAKPINNDDLQFFLGFELDGVKDFTNVTAIHVYRDPVFHRFDSTNNVHYYIRSKDAFLRLKGERLDYSTSINDFTVLVGRGRCDVTDLATNQLTCKPPLIRPGFLDEWRGPDESLPVVVLVGYLKFHVGFVKYTDSDEKELILWLSITAILMLWVVTLCACIGWNLRRRTGTSNILGTGTANVNGIGPSKTGVRGVGEYLYTGDSSDDTAVTIVPPLDVEVAHIASGDLWSAIEEPLLSKVKEHQVDSSRLKLGECIGVGSFGRVYKGEMEEADGGGNMEVAVKTLRDGSVSGNELPQFLEEALVMAGFEHEHILPLYGVVVNGSIPYVISEFMDKGDLRSFVKQTSKAQTGPGELLNFARQVAVGMVYLSARGFIHRDLAARNCLVNHSNSVKIGDFGLSRDLHGADYYKVGDIGRPLPVKWMSVESLNLGKFSSRSDVWSFGVVMWELLTRGRTPYDSVPNVDLKNHINLDNRLPQPEEASDEMQSLMERCWRCQPDERPTFEDLVTALEELINNNVSSGPDSQIP